MVSKGKVSSEERIAMQVSTASIVANVLLSVFKFFAGIVSHSSAMISDAIHSASDIVSTVFVMVGIKLANRDSDDKHQYGHERVECIASIILAVALGATGLMIGISAVECIQGMGEKPLKIPGGLALIAAFVSIVVKEGMFWFTKIAADKIHSNALMADAWHHRSDAFSSIGSLIGIGGAKIGYPVLDPIASIIICIMIVKTAIDIFWDSIRKMIDEACSEEVEEEIRMVVLDVPNVLGIDLLKTRMFGNRIYVDIEILAYGEQTLREAHHIAEVVHDRVEEMFPQVKHCMVHINPTFDEKDEEV